MQLALRCRACAEVLVVHPGPLIDVPYGMGLVELLAEAEESHNRTCAAAQVLSASQEESYA